MHCDAVHQSVSGMKTLSVKTSLAATHDFEQPHDLREQQWLLCVTQRRTTR